MCETEYFKTLIIVIILFWTISLCDSNETSFSLIKNKEIFNEGNIVSIRSLLEGNVTHNSMDISKHPNIMYTSRKCMYADTIVDLLQTFFEIFVYGVNSHTEIDVPDIKEHTKSWLVSAIDHFNNIKTPIAKTIDELFFHSNKNTMLRTSDQSLLKSLLSINLFLCYSTNSSPFLVYTEVETDDSDESVYIMYDNDLYKTIENIRVLNTSIIQMVGLVERFRSKRCVVENPYKTNSVINKKLKDISIHDVDNIRNLLQPFLNRLNVLINNGSDIYDNFNSNKYDPEYLLFEKLLVNQNSFLGNLQINFNGNVSTLKSVFNDEKTIYNIEHILELQHILLNVIAEVFYIQIYNLSRNTSNGITDLTDLLSTFEEYTSKMLPSNCSINVCNRILKSQVYLDKALESYNYTTESVVFWILKNHFGPENNIEPMNQTRTLHNTTLPEFTDQSLFFLFRNMWRSKQFKSFRKVINLLSYESYTNSNFKIVKIPDHVEIVSSQKYDKNFFKSMIEFQYALFAFWTLLKIENNYQVSNDITHYSTVDLSDLSAIGFTLPESGHINSNNYVPEIKCRECEENVPTFVVMLRVIVKFYEFLYDEPSVKNIILPLLIYLNQTDLNSLQIIKYDLAITLQISFLTIIVLENYLINNYSFAFYSLFIYSKFFTNDENEPDPVILRHYLHVYAETSTTSFEYTLEFLSLLYDANSQNTFFPEDDKQIEFFWNGSRQNFGYDIHQTVVKGVTDYNDFISLYWFGVKWCVSNILQKIMNALFLLRYSESEQTFIFLNNTIRNMLNDILKLELPNTVKIFMDNAVNAFLVILNIEWSNVDYVFNQCDAVFDHGLIELGAHFSYDKPLCSEIDTIIGDMNFETEKLKNILQSNMFGTQNMLNSTDLCLSPVEERISIKIIEVLYEVD